MTEIVWYNTASKRQTQEDRAEVYYRQGNKYIYIEGHSLPFESERGW